MNNTEHENICPTKISRDFKGLWIPREIWLHPRLSLQAKSLWAEIHSLHNRDVGGCFASDEYFEEFMQIKRSRLHEIYKELYDEGLLIKVSFDGRRTIRRVIEPIDHGGRQLSGKPDTSNSSCPENRTPPIRKTGFAPYIENKDENKDLYVGACPEPHKKIVLKKEKKQKTERKFIEFESYPFLRITEEEHEKLVGHYGNEKLRKIFKFYSDWQQSKSQADPKTLGLHTDYHRIIKWAAEEALKQSAVKSIQKDEISVEITGARREEMKEYRKNNWNKIKSLGICFEDKIHYMLINNDKLYFKDVNFYDNLAHYLLKVGLE